MFYICHNHDNNVPSCIVLDICSLLLLDLTLKMPSEIGADNILFYFSEKIRLHIAI